MRKRFAELPTQPLSISQAITLSLDYCNFGRLDFCDFMCARILAADAQNLYGRLVRGLSAFRRRDTDRALAYLGEVTLNWPRFADGYLHTGNALLQQGRLEAAAVAYTQALALHPDYPEVLAGLGETLRRQGRGGEALALLAQAVALKPNYSPSYISYSLMCFERSLPPGQMPAGRRLALTDRPRLTMASLGNYGRFAQTVNEYLAVRLYALKYGMEFFTPDWVGHAFFEIDDPFLPLSVQAEFEEWLTVREDFTAGFDGVVEQPFRDRDLFLGGSPVDVFRPAHKEAVQGWMRPRSCWNAYLEPPVAALRARGRTLVALHIRRTDWWNQNYSPLQLYHDWLAEVWSGLDDPVLFVSTDDPSIVSEFQAYRPATSADFPVRWEGLEYLQDFHVLSQADIVAISTGGFAQTAAAFNRDGRLFLRPSANDSRLEPYDPWLYQPPAEG